VSSLRNPEPIHIGLISDEPIRLAGLASVFDQPSGEGKAQFVPVIGTLTELLRDPDLQYLVVDLNCSSNGLETLEKIRLERPGIRQIVIGPHGNDELIEGSIWASRRVLSRLIDRLIQTPEASAAPNNPRLSDREREVLDLILLARSNREIAQQLGIEERTVKAHVGRLMRKTGSDNRIGLSMRALSAARASLATEDRRQKDRREGDRRQDSGATGPYTTK